MEKQKDPVIMDLFLLLHVLFLPEEFFIDFEKIKTQQQWR